MRRLHVPGGRRSEEPERLLVPGERTRSVRKPRARCVGARGARRAARRGRGRALHESAKRPCEGVAAPPRAGREALGASSGALPGREEALGEIGEALGEVCEALVEIGEAPGRVAEAPRGRGQESPGVPRPSGRDA